MRAGRSSLVRSGSRLGRYAAVTAMLVSFAACNGILGIGEPDDPPDKTGGRGGNSGAQGEHGGESGDSSGGSTNGRMGGSSGSSATGGSVVGGAGGGSAGEDSGGSGAGKGGNGPDAGKGGSPGDTGGASTGGVTGGQGGGHIPEAGAGGSPDDGDPTGGDEDVVEPLCSSIGYPAVLFAPSAGLGVSFAWDGETVQAYASRPAQQIMAATWQYPSSPDVWSGWVCFDAIRRPNRVSATNLLDQTPEIFVTTTDGQMLVRRMYFDIYGQWGPWWPFDLPRANSRVSDVHVVGAPNLRTRLYVTDSGYVFGRERKTDEPRAPYGPWRRLGTLDAVLITAGITVSGGEQIFVADSNGVVLSSTDPTGAEGWNVLPTDGPVRDLDVGYGSGGLLNLYTLGTDGAVKFSSQTSETEWTTWETTKEWDEPPNLVSITVLHQGMTDRIFGIDAAGRVLEMEQSGWHTF